MKKISIALSLLTTGLVAGVVIGILFAPYKGSKTRRKLAQRGEEIKDVIRSRFNKFNEFLSDKLDGKAKVMS